MENLIQTLAIWALPVIFAITLHEAAHGYVARYFGDPTAWQLGRVSLNPLRHIDPVGTILVPGLILATSSLLAGGGILFGWAKPVPVNFSRLNNPKRDMLWVAAAGPGANLVMTLAWACLIKLATLMPDSFFALPMVERGKAGIRINAALMLLNLLPIPPLDGGRIAISLLPQHLAWRFARLEPYGFMILLALLFTGVLGNILGPLVFGFIHLILLLFGF
ncbi:MAG: site-2 protease family protein [Proteobacteria bacterium]|nr:site-2 protease family protein [Pseudomonadota bacterium]